MTHETKKQLREQITKLKRELEATHWERKIKEAVNAVPRREVLEKVIEALELPYVAFTGFPIGAPDSGKRYYDTDRFWGDINTALEVRAERKAAEQRDATEKKIAGLAASVPAKKEKTR